MFTGGKCQFNLTCTFYNYSKIENWTIEDVSDGEGTDALVGLEEIFPIFNNFARKSFNDLKEKEKSELSWSKHYRKLMYVA